MQLGFVSAIVGDLDLRGVFELAARLKYDCVELMCWPAGPPDRRYAGVTHVDVGHSATADLAAIRRLAADHGVGLSALGYYPNPLSPDSVESKTAVDHLRRVMAAAAELGVGINTFIGRDPRLSIDDNWPRFLDTWGPLIDEAARLKVRTGIENCPMLFSHEEWPGGKNLAISPSVWRRMFAELNSPWLGLNFDPSHLVWQWIDWERAILEFGPRIFHVHAKDVVVNREGLYEHGGLALPSLYHEPRIPGRGEIDWQRFINALRSAGYSGPVCVEVEDRAFEGSLALREQSLAASAAHLRPLIQNR